MTTCIPTVSRACLQQGWDQGSAHCQDWLSWLSGTGTQQPGHGQGALYLPGPTLITPFLRVANKGLSLVHLIGMKMGQALGNHWSEWGLRAPSRGWSHASSSLFTG